MPLRWSRRAAALIVLSHYSTHVSRLTGKNAVQVLATLFLVSYTTSLHLVIEVTLFTKITYPDGYKQTVWLTDGNVEFFYWEARSPCYSDHSLCAALPALHLHSFDNSVPLQILSLSHHVRGLEVKTGLLLIARIALLVTFAVNQSNNLSINFLAIITVSVVLLGWFGSGNCVCESHLNNFLEIMFLGNLSLTAVTLFFDIHNNKHSSAYTSTSVAFVIFYLRYPLSSTIAAVTHQSWLKGSKNCFEGYFIKRVYSRK